MRGINMNRLIELTDIQELLDDNDVLRDALGPKAWPNTGTTLSVLRTAMLNADHELLGRVIMDCASQYIVEMAQKE